MSTFFLEDIVAFKADPSIIGSIKSTWSDIDHDLCETTKNCFVHKSLPSNVKVSWFEDMRLLPGYVVVGFLHDYDDYCLVSGASLSLVDRSLAVGDVVRKCSSDTQSGTIISTSLMCNLRPLCTEADYNARECIPAQGYTPSHRPGAPRHNPDSNRLLHGFPRTTRSQSVSDSHRQQVSSDPSLQVSAQELTHWNIYREEDFVIYRDWVGQIRSIYDEVTVRLTNGSVVVVEDAGDLRETYWIPGTASYELVQRFDRAGYYKVGKYLQGNLKHWKPRSSAAEPCYPGQHVRTKKGNLRCGRWTFGAYDPSVPPEGLVVDVRCVELEVRWAYPNQVRCQRFFFFVKSLKAQHTHGVLPTIITVNVSRNRISLL